MLKQKAADPKDVGSFEWKFKIPEISPVFKEINTGIFRKIAEPNVYTADDEYHNLVDQYISEGHINVYVAEEEPLITPPKRYEIEDGRFMLYESKSRIEDSEMVWHEYGRPITDNFYMLIDTDVHFDDGIEKIHKYRGRIIVGNGTNEFKFDVDSRLFAIPQDMAKMLSNVGGAKVVFDNRNLMDIRNATQTLSKYESREISQVFGWYGKVYQSQSSIIFPGVVKSGDSNVDLSDIPYARNLDIKAITDKEFKAVGDHIVTDLMHVHERYPIDCLFGFTFLAPIASKITDSDDWDGGKIGMWIVGTSGCGKSYTALLFQNFFGVFKGKKPVFGWSGTPYSIQVGGYYFNDSIFMVDDFKIVHFSGNGLDQAVMVLQNYADGTSRTRLNTGMGLSDGKPINGSMLITGEDVIEDVASVMARYHVVEMEKQYINRDAGKRTKKYRKLYNGFMGRYIAWLSEDKDHVKKIVNRVEKLKDEFIGDRTSSNIDRVAQSFAYNLVGFDMFCRFLEKNDFISMEKHIEMVKIHKNNLFFHIDINVADVRAANVSEVFINTLSDLINSGKVNIYTVVKGVANPYGLRDEYIGFDVDDQYIYFFGVPVWNAVTQAVRIGSGKGMMNSKKNLMSELVKGGIMIPGTQGKTFNKTLDGKAFPTWRILKSSLGYKYTDNLDILNEVDISDMPEFEDNW